MGALPSVLDGDVLERSPEYRRALLGLTTDVLPAGAPDLVRIYRSTRNLAFRNRILTLLRDCDLPGMAQFFDEAYTRERYHSMKMIAMRGLAQFVSEREIADRLAKLRASLRNVEQSTPLNFTEYELLLAPSGLPYLVHRYGYPCLHETLEQVRAQYARMPAAVKGLVTVDESGDLVVLVTQEDYHRRVAEAISETRSKASGRADHPHNNQ